CALVRGAAVSCRRQISRATASGSAVCPPTSSELSASDPRLAERRTACEPDLLGTALSRHDSERRADRRGGLRRNADVQPRSEPQPLVDPLLDLVRHVGVLAQVVPRVLLALTQLVAVVGVPGTGLADDRLLDTQVDQAALTADAETVEDIELGNLE